MSHHLTPIDPEAVAQARDALPPEDLLTLVVEAFDALADQQRLPAIRYRASGWRSTAITSPALCWC